MNKIPIPKSIQLHGETISIEYRTDMIHERGCDGEAAYNEECIRIQKTKANGKPQEDFYLEKIFLHELVHFILNQMSEGDLKRNEKFVEVFSGLLHQAFKNAEYEKE